MGQKVVNCHHYGGVDKLPSTVKYIGRPSEHGNSHSSKSGKYSKEECVAFHRVDLYERLIADKGYMEKLISELGGYDLGCWCKQEKKLKACHGDNFLHVFSPELSDRTYDRSVLFYLVDDLKRVMKTLREQCRVITADEWFWFWIHTEDVRVEVIELLRLFEERETDPYMRCVWLANVVIDLELAAQETNMAMKEYRLDHSIWTCFRYTCRPTGRDSEPTPPDLTIKRPKRGKDKHDQPE